MLKKPFSKRVNEAGKSTVTLYYKGDALLVQEKVDDYDVSKVPGENPLETMKEAVAKSQEKFKDLMGHGFELTSEYKDGIFYIRKYHWLHKNRF